MSAHGWIGVDLDGTLAQYDGWQGAEHIGPPVEPMLARVKAWLAAGVEVRIFTARVFGEGRAVALPPIEAYCLHHFGRTLPVTCEKDYAMVELWDDRAVQVIPNTGQRADEHVSIRMTAAVRKALMAIDPALVAGFDAKGGRP